MKYLAQGLQIDTGGGNSIGISGPLIGITNLGDLVNKMMEFLIPIAGILLFFIIIWGGYDILLSRGEPEKLDAGKQKITAGVIGMVLLVMSYLIAKTIGFIFGVGDGFL